MQYNKENKDYQKDKQKKLRKQQKPIPYKTIQKNSKLADFKEEDVEIPDEPDIKIVGEDDDK